MVGVILGSGPVRLEGMVVVPNRSNFDRIVRRDRIVQGTTSVMALSEKPLSSMYWICSCFDGVSRGAMSSKCGQIGPRQTAGGKDDEREDRGARTLAPSHHYESYF